MSLKRKRTVVEEKLVLNSKWEMNYFMIETAAHTMVCLICSQVVKTVKGDNAKQHFCRHMSHPNAKLEGESKKRRACLLLSNLLIVAVKLLIEWHIILVWRGNLFPMENWLSDTS